MSRIELDLRNTIHKTQGVGQTWITSQRDLWITPEQLLYKHCLFGLVGPHGSGGIKTHAVLEVAFVDQFEELMLQVQPAVQLRVLFKRSPYVVDLVARLRSVWVHHEGDLFASHWVCSDVNEPTAWAEPHGVELGLDEHAFDFPDSPAQDLLSAMGFNLPSDGGKAFIAHSVRHGLTANMDRHGCGVAGGLSGDLDGVGFDGGVGGGHGDASATGNPHFAN